MAQLVVTIDTEEEGLWGGQFHTQGNTVANISGVPRFQQLCDEFGIQPTYLIDAPVVSDPAAREILASIHADGRAEIGAHLHPWCSPPITEFTHPRESFMCNLPADLQRDKLTWLTEEIESVFGERPISFRAGRYGLDMVGARLLHELGYQVDSSVIPFSNYAGEGGPNFEQAPHKPYWLDLEANSLSEATLPADGHEQLLEVPVGVGYARGDFRRCHDWFCYLRDSIWSKFRLIGILDRVGWLKRIKLSPEQADLGELTQLASRYLSSQSVMVLMFHSSSLMPGNSPYVRNEADLEEFYRRLKGIFKYCLDGGAIPHRLGHLYGLHRSNR